MKILEVQVGNFFRAQSDILIHVDRKSHRIVHRWRLECRY